MGRYKVDQTTGNLSLLAGRGKAEYGASTCRKGTFTITGSSSGVASATITFSTAMPDTDYEIILTDTTTPQTEQITSFTVSNKTTTGFTVNVYSANNVTGSYTAFKLYTDTEYNEVLETLTSPWVDISSDASTYIDSGYIKYKKIGQIVIVKMWDVIFKANGSGNILSSNLPTCDDSATSRIFRDQKDGLGALYVNTNSKNLYCHHALPSGETTQTKWYGEMVYTTSD